MNKIVLKCEGNTCYDCAVYLETEDGEQHSLPVTEIDLRITGSQETEVIAHVGIVLSEVQFEAKDSDVAVSVVKRLLGGTRIVMTPSEIDKWLHRKLD